MTWLRHEYNGPLDVAEAQANLELIGTARDPLNLAHVRFLDEGDRRLTGALATEVMDDGSVEVTVDSEHAFTFRTNEFQEASLHTDDGANYYGLQIRLSGKVLQIEDAYNTHG
jgi:hypothetical protein